MTQPEVFQLHYLEVVELAHHALSATEAPYCVRAHPKTGQILCYKKRTDDLLATIGA